MPYFVKSRGPAVLKRGPCETEDEAKRERERLLLDTLYAGQEIYVEYQPFSEPERKTLLRPHRKKLRSRGRSSSRAGERSSGGGGSPKMRHKRRHKRQPNRRSGRRR